jgi:predicted nuclease of predicted toxin-antitoxin system
MKIRLMLDEDVHAGLGLILRRRGYDVAHVQELSRQGLSDEEQLSHAIAEKRCLVSFNVRDFVVLHNHYARTGQEHFGIVVSKQRPLKDTLRLLLGLLQSRSAEAVYCQLVFL